MAHPGARKSLWRNVFLRLSVVVLAAAALVPAAAADAVVTKPNDTRRACEPPTRAHFASCFAVVRTGMPQRDADSVPWGYGPADLGAAYTLPSSTGGAGLTVAVVVAYDHPTAEADLAVYRARFGLPPCTTATGCFRKVDQNGGTSYPRADQGWAMEAALDVDMVSAVCPLCRILLVEARQPLFDDLGAAVSTAVRLGAMVVSNSYGTDEWSTESAYDPFYNQPGVAITASSGDFGYGVSYPAASPYVTAVGGTSLVAPSTGRGWAETAWSGAGSGCSGYEAKPGWQTDAGCGARAVADVSAVADPETGVAAYDSFGAQGWMVFGGTSVSAPIIAGVYALAGRPGANTYPASYPYAHVSALNDVVTGSNGSCTPGYLCSAGTGYDGPTGLGTPNGVLAFTKAGGSGALVNGGFETGNLAGWTTAGVAGPTTSTAHGGSYAAMVGSLVPSGLSSIAQTFTAPAGASSLSLWYRVFCPDTVTYDWATATLRDNTSATTRTILPKTCVANSGWRQVTASIVPGHNYALTLVSRDDNYPGDPTYTVYDDVVVS